MLTINVHRNRISLFPIRLLDHALVPNERLYATIMRTNFQWVAEGVRLHGFGQRTFTRLLGPADRVEPHGYVCEEEHHATSCSSCNGANLSSESDP